MAAAMQASAFERAVFVRSLNGGFFYWSSKNDIFSSDVLAWIVAERQQNSAQKTS